MDRDAELRKLRDDAERYRQAAQDALEQLDWCIGYLHGARKQAIAAALGRNRAHIRKQLLGKAEQPTPSSATGEA